MSSRWPVITSIVVLAVTYLAYPYVTLYRLDVAVRRSDAVSLRKLVDWYSVREGLKEDICDMVLDEPKSTVQTSNELAPFGSGFVQGMTGNALDRTVTPEAVASLSHAASPADTEAPPLQARVAWAFFDGPTQFLVHVQTDVAPEPIEVEMTLRGMRWKVQRIHLPDTLLGRAGGRT